MKQSKIINNANLQDTLLTNRIGKFLTEKFPGNIWAVNVHQGVVDIKAYNVSQRYGYRLFYNEIDDRLTKVLIAGGELLERAHMSTGRREQGSKPVTLEGAKIGHRQCIEAGIIV